MTKVLVVDDDPGIRELLVAILDRRGYETCTAADGQEGLVQFQLEQPDLLTTDLRMPNMDGYELCCRVRQSSRVPIIVITGMCPADEARKRAILAGASSFLEKPFRLRELLEQIHLLTEPRPSSVL